MNKKAALTIIILAAAAVAYLAYFKLEGAPLASEVKAVELQNGDTYDLEAAYVSKTIGGRIQKMLAYNGSIPGPTINVEQGAEVTINFKNSTDMPALLHSHGVRMENNFDGSQSVQTEIKPGGSFSYKLKFPDAGVYWYHPHVNEPYQQALGLFGAFVVTSKDSKYLSPANKETVMFLSDLPIENGKIAIEKNRSTHSLSGHFGNVMLVNGEENPEFSAKQGEVVRLLVINASNARPYNFTVEGLKMKLVGGDSGAYEKAKFVDSVILGPSERAIIDVLAQNSGAYKILNKTPQHTYALATINVTGEKTDESFETEFQALGANSETIKGIDPFRIYFDKPADKKLSLTLDMDMMGGMGGGHMHGGMGMGSAGGIEWEDEMAMMNQMSTPDSVKWKIVDTATGKANDEIDFKFEKGKPVKIEIFNDPDSAHPMQHPIHFHGQRFLVLSHDGIKETNLVWKDTVFVKAGERVEILLDPSNPGKWMAHCHISEHLESGMMFEFEVI